MTQATQIKELFNLLKEYADLFLDKISSKLPSMRKINYKIRLIPRAKQKLERIFSHDRFKDQITEKIDRELIIGKIYATTNIENAVLMFTQLKKGSKKARFLLNYVLKNLVTIKDKTLLPNMDELLNWISEQEYITKLDLVDGYHNLNIRYTEESEKYSTFLYHPGYFRSKVMQLGDCNAPATMMRVIQDLLRAKQYTGIVVYLDSIIIRSKTYKEHVSLVRYVLDILRKEEFYLNKDKYQFMSKRFKVLGHIIIPAKLFADPIKIEKVLEF